MVKRNYEDLTFADDFIFCKVLQNDPQLCDGTEKIFLSTKGKMDDISEELKEFLHYITENEVSNDFTKKLEAAVSVAKQNPGWRKEYMDFRDYLDDARAEGLKEGLEKGEDKGRSDTVISLIKKEVLTPEEGAQELGISVEKLNDILYQPAHKNEQP